MNKLMRRFRIHPLFWVVIGIGIATGYFYELLMLFTIVFVHELGHASTAHFFRWRIKKVELLPFGGVAQFEEYGNRPIKEEFLVVIAGPFQHFWLMGLSILLVQTSFWSWESHQLFLTHNLIILLFNLLPIWPLDGGKLLLLLFSNIYPYRKAQSRTLLVSLSFLGGGITFAAMFFPFHLQLWTVLLFLLASHYLEWRQQPYGFFRFLLERSERTMKEGRDISHIEYINGNEKIMTVLKKIRKAQQTAFYDRSRQRLIHEKDLLQLYFGTDRFIDTVEDYWK